MSAGNIRLVICPNTIRVENHHGVPSNGWGSAKDEATITRQSESKSACLSSGLSVKTATPVKKKIRAVSSGMSRKDVKNQRAKLTRSLRSVKSCSCPSRRTVMV